MAGEGSDHFSRQVTQSGPSFVEQSMMQAELHDQEARVRSTSEFDERYPELFVLAKRAALRVVNDQSDAQDVAAETMARALVAWAKVSRYPEPWVTRVAVNRAIDLCRRRVPPAQLPPVALDEESTVSRLTLIEAMRRLPRRQREVVALRYLVDLSEADTAEVLGIGPETVATHLRRGLVAMRVQLHEDEGATDATH
jgi:RNA polymerase sigma factor (sigma-70 family)